MGDQQAFAVGSLPGVEPADLVPGMHAGHIDVDPQFHGAMFFWDVPSRDPLGRSRTIIWLNGGPGCSSMDGALMEVGPYRVHDGGKLTANPGSWHEESNVLFVDQPLGTGFSFVDTDHYLHELEEMAQHFLSFMDGWFQEFPERRHDEFWLAGESFAGQYIPYIGRAMLDRQHIRHPNALNLRGVMINNGWVEPLTMYKSYLPKAVEAGLIAPGSPEHQAVEAVIAECDKAIEKGGTQVSIGECESILSKVTDVTLIKGNNDENVCVNVYDMRLRDKYPACGMSWPPDLEFVTPYLRRQDVINALHVNRKTSGWSECSGAVSSAFRAQNSRPASFLIPDLAAEIPVHFISGDQDLICNSLGQTYFLDQLIWNGERGFATKDGSPLSPVPWRSDGVVAGTYVEARNISHVIFHNASHMSPFDWPLRARELAYGLMGVQKLDLAKMTLAQEQAENESTAARYLKLLKDYRNGAIALVLLLVIVSALVGFRFRHSLTRYGHRLILRARGQSLKPSGRVHGQAQELDEFRLGQPLFERGDDDDDAFALHDGDLDEENDDDNQDDRLKRDASNGRYSRAAT
ncbi:Cell death protease [Savitreella phatthalungensis]